MGSCSGVFPVDLPVRPLLESFCWLKIGGDSHGGHVSRSHQMFRVVIESAAFLPMVFFLLDLLSRLYIFFFARLDFCNIDLVFNYSKSFQ